MCVQLPIHIQYYATGTRTNLNLRSTCIDTCGGMIPALIPITYGHYKDNEVYPIGYTYTHQTSRPRAGGDV